MKILAIETATEACSAAVLCDNQIYIRFEHAPRQHTQLILPMVEAVLAEAEITLQQLDAIAFGRGPGAFTGVRIAIGVVQGLALAADKPVIAISTLAAMAQQIYCQYQQKNIVAALDARMKEVYWGMYHIEQQFAVLQQEEVVITPAQVPLMMNKDWVGVGSAWSVYAREFQPEVTKKIIQTYPNVLPSAEYIALLAKKEYQEGHLLSVEEARPIYLRNKVAQTIKERAMKIANNH